jgi:hypothetical protein
MRITFINNDFCNRRFFMSAFINAFQSSLYQLAEYCSGAKIISEFHINVLRIAIFN